MIAKLHIVRGKRIAAPGVRFSHEDSGPHRSCDACFSGSRDADGVRVFEHADACPAALDALERYGEERRP